MHTIDRLHGVRWIAMALVALVVAGVLTPLCTMPECSDTGTVACGDFKPACDDCPDAIVMKHDPGDAVEASPVRTGDAVALAVLPGDVPPAVVALAHSLPEPTASPPPLDPLGVRLLV